MIVSFIAKLPEAKSIFRFYFKSAQPLKNEPGQFITLSLPHDKADDRGTRRFFTLSSSPTEPDPFITTKLSQPGSSFKQHLANLAPGAEIEMDEPSGTFTLAQNPHQPLVFVAGGIGITPFRSILKYLHDKKQKRPIQLLYSAKSAEEFAFKDLFDQIEWLETTYIVSAPSASWPGPTGQLNIERITELADGLDGKLVYLSGPEPMIEALNQQLLDANHPEELIKTDYFPGYKQI